MQGDLKLKTDDYPQFITVELTHLKRKTRKWSHDIRGSIGALPKDKNNKHTMMKERNICLLRYHLLHSGCRMPEENDLAVVFGEE